MARQDNPPRRVMVAIGGNATHPENIEGTSEEQKAIAEKTASALLPIAMLDNELIITHGNGPVVGKILMRQALTSKRIAPMPLDICVAHSQGGIAYLLMQAMENALRRNESERHVACLLSQVEVDAEDPAFKSPSKPIGPFFSEDEALLISEELSWEMKEDAGRGWRHVVPSPKPKHICDISLIEALARRGTVVISGGGGGTPVIRGEKGVRDGVSAVIDKDLTTAKMASVLNFDVMMILTTVSKVYMNFGKPSQYELDEVSLEDLERFFNQGHFMPGSMAPKIEAAIQFLSMGGSRVVISSLANALDALNGKTGTQIYRDASNTG